MSGYLPISATNTQGMNYDSLLVCKTNIGGYFFDGFMSVEHEYETQITQHPVETGASIVDHAFIKPRKVTIDVVVSDVHQSFVAGQFNTAYARHVSAWKVLKEMQEARIPFTVFTKLATYNNMLIERLSATDTYKTYQALVAKVSLVEIPMARLKTVKISLNPNTTSSNVLPQQNTRQVLQSTLHAMFNGPIY